MSEGWISFSVDGMLFGATGKCPMCSSPIEYRDGQYKCKGFLTAWSKCTFTTREPERKAGKWKIPQDVLDGNDYLKEVGRYPIISI